MPDTREPPQSKPWTFLTNHARVLICIARNPRIRLRDIAEKVQITERATQEIVNDLEEAGYLNRHRVGRRNTYTLTPDRPFRHPADADHHVRDLINIFTDRDDDTRPHPVASTNQGGGEWNRRLHSASPSAP